jgi:hypothetical protein
VDQLSIGIQDQHGHLSQIPFQKKKRMRGREKETEGERERDGKKEGKKERKEGRKKKSQVPLAHSCNSSYSRGRDQEDHGSKPAWANSSQDPMLKNTVTNKGWWCGSRKALSSNPSTAKRKKE